MREIDKLECWAMGRSPKEGLRLGLRTSHLCWTAMKDGWPIAMLGVASTSLMTGKGVIWLLGTDEVYRQGRALLHLGPMVFGAMLQEFRVLENVVSVQNTKAIRLLRRWGFTVDGFIEQHRGVDFVPFKLERPSLTASVTSSIQGERQPV